MRGACFLRAQKDRGGDLPWKDPRTEWWRADSRRQKNIDWFYVAFYEGAGKDGIILLSRLVGGTGLVE